VLAVPVPKASRASPLPQVKCRPFDGGVSAHIKDIANLHGGTGVAHLPTGAVRTPHTGGWPAGLFGAAICTFGLIGVTLGVAYCCFRWPS
jgi:hypothetical protein